MKGLFAMMDIWDKIVTVFVAIWLSSSLAATIYIVTKAVLFKINQ